MPNHIHLLLFIDGKLLSGFMRDFKKYITQKAVKKLDLKSSSIWMPRFDRAVVITNKVFITKLKYIHNNPVKDALVTIAEDWKWSSASDYNSDVQGGVEIWKEWIV